MIPPRLRSLLNSVLWVLGAVVIGGALNTSVVSGEAPLTAPAILFQLAVGVVLIVVGFAVRPTPDGLPGRAESDQRPEETDTEFDPDLSPLGPEDDDEAE